MNYTSWIFSCLGLVQAITVDAAPFRVSKSDFHLIGIVVQCRPNCEYSDETSGSVLDMGFIGEGKFADPERISSAPDSGGPHVVVGFPEERFDWKRYTINLTGTPYTLALLNEITSSGKNYAFLTVWKPIRDSLDFVRILPGYFSAPIGEFSFHGKARAENRNTLILIKGIGSDAGINLQSFIAVRIRGLEKLEKSFEVSNKSEIPVADILARLNDGKAVEEVIDSTLNCELWNSARGNALRCSKTRTKILYNQSGPQETPLGKENFTFELPPFQGRR